MLVLSYEELLLCALKCIHHTLVTSLTFWSEDLSAASWTCVVASTPHTSDPSGITEQQQMFLL